MLPFNDRKEGKIGKCGAVDINDGRGSDMRWEELKDITFGENAVDSETMTVSSETMTGVAATI